MPERKERPWIEPAVELRGALDMIRVALESVVTRGTLPPPRPDATPGEEAEVLAKAIKALADERDALAKINPK